MLSHASAKARRQMGEWFGCGDMGLKNKGFLTNLQDAPSIRPTFETWKNNMRKTQAKRP